MRPPRPYVLSGALLPERGHGLLDLYEDPEAELYRWFREHRLPEDSRAP